MKKLICLFATAAMLIMMQTVAVNAADSGKNLGSVPESSAALKLDGTKETVYSKALHISGNYTQDGNGTVTAKAEYYLLYYSSALWVYAEITDATLNTKADSALTSSYKVDSIEVMVDFDNSGANDADKTPLQCRVDHQGYISARAGQKGTSLYGSAAEGGNVKFFEAKTTKTSGGFNAEYRIPFTSSSLKKGSKIGLNLCYNDWDKADGTRVTMCSTNLVNSWTPASFDYVVLGDVLAADTTAAAAAATTVKAAGSSAVKAAQTSDTAMQLLAAVAAVTGAYAAYAVPKRRRRS